MNNGTTLTLGSLFSGSGGFELGGVLAGVRPVWNCEVEPFPVRVTTKRFPDVTHYGDITHLHGDRIEPVDIITFGSPCFPAGTLVLTDKGFAEIEKIRTGDRVLTHKGRWRRVTATGAKTAPTIRLKGNHYGLVCTANHPVYSLDGGRYEWIPAEKMKGRLWGVPNRTEYIPVPHSESGNRRLKPMPEFTDGIPSWMYSMPEEHRLAVLRELIESGGDPQEHSVRFTAVSKKLAFSIRILAETLGYSTAVYHPKQQEGYVTEIFEKGFRSSDGSVSWYRVKDVLPESGMDIVYNLTVEEDNSYTADSIIVHNCQDMSVAGKRSGLDGSRSSLFYEAVRIIKEMRCATNGRYPRFLVWENVPGAFSSNKGQDFKAVLEEICRIKDPEVSLPLPEKWGPAGRILGDRYSVAWRQLDAQFWGVPQRRKRIYLVADLADRSAGEILFVSEGLSGYSAEGFRAWQAAAGASAVRAGETGTVCLNDQGGSRMDVTEGMTCTLRAEAHHPPCVMGSAGFCVNPSANAHGIGYEEETSPTVCSGNVPAVVENHPADGRVKLGTDGTVQTLTSRMGTGGNNVPLLLKLRGGCEGGGKGPLVQTDRSATLSCGNDQTLFQPAESVDCRNMALNEEVSGTLQAKDGGGFSLNYINPVVYGICSKESNSMKSDNPRSGFYEAETTRTLDANGGSPSCNQGGMAVIEGNGSRPSHKGDGYKESEIMYTLNATEQHGVAYGAGPSYSASKASFFTEAAEEKANTLVATDYKDPPLVNDRPSCAAEPDYIVRRLTPTECARLQGFPDWWCGGLSTPHPSEEDITFWREVFETHRTAAGGSGKPKTEKQIVKWLKDPHTDSAEYKMWGNGVALPCVYFVLSGIVWAAETGAREEGSSPENSV